MSVGGKWQRLVRRAISSVVSLLPFAGPALAQGEPNKPVNHLDLQHYVGRWYEIARLPLFFERKCVGEMTATYALQADGRVSVRNACLKANGQRDVADGMAKVVPGRPGALKVSFAPRGLSWIPWVWADYWVIHLDPGYQWAVVGSPSRQYLWILSRTRKMDPQVFDELRQRVTHQGYDVSKLIVADDRR